MPGVVADAIRDYMTSSYVQLGADYPLSVAATGTVQRAHDLVNVLMNGEGIGQTVLGPSSTQLVTMLAECYSRHLEAGDEVILCETGHEANVGPWLKLQRFGIKIKWWKVRPDFTCSLEDLAQLFTDRTRLVCFPLVSNLLGEIVDVAAITQLAHKHNTRVVVDAVAYAPHRALDVKAWAVDWCFFSTYKTYGPHMGALFGRTDAFDELEGPNHFFIPADDPYKFELGGVSHEGCAGLLALGDYLKGLAGHEVCDRPAVAAAFEEMTRLELPVQARLISYLKSKPVRIIGPAHAEASRISTISFLHDSVPSPEISRFVNSRGIGIRNGHMYSYRLCERLGIDVESGVVRVSAVHYNTVEEIDRLIGVLDEVL